MNLRLLLADRQKTSSDLARLLWKKSSKKVRAVNISRLLSGRTVKISPEWVWIICEFLDTDPNELFNPYMTERVLQKIREIPKDKLDPDAKKLVKTIESFRDKYGNTYDLTQHKSIINQIKKLNL